MGRRRRKFSPEYKDEAVKPVINTGRTATVVVARELGINEATLGRWVNLQKNRQGVDGDDPLSESERAELARLRTEVSELGWIGCS